MVKPLSTDRMRRVCMPGAELDEPAFVDLLNSYAHAMWSWSRAENKLFVLFVLCVGGESPSVAIVKKLQAVFFSPISPQVRLDMLHDAATLAWSKTRAWGAWMALHDECRTYLATRGRMAHLCGYAFYPKGRNGKPHALIMLPPWHPSSPVSYGQAKSVGFDAEQLMDYAQQWGMLETRLGVFATLVREVMKPQPSDALIARLLQITGVQGDQNSVARKRRRKPYAS